MASKTHGSGPLLQAFVADNRYFVKVTVNRPSFFSRNPRHIVPFVFCPIEPPRPPQNDQIFIRKKHALTESPNAAEPGFWGGLFRKTASSLTGNAGVVSFEARLPRPAILVPTETIALTLSLTRDDDSKGTVYIRTIQVMLGITTYIAAQGFRRELQSSSNSLPDHWSQRARNP